MNLFNNVQIRYYTHAPEIRFQKVRLIIITFFFVSLPEIYLYVSSTREAQRQDGRKRHANSPNMRGDAGHWTSGTPSRPQEPQGGGWASSPHFQLDR